MLLQVETSFWTFLVLGRVQLAAIFSHISYLDPIFYLEGRKMTDISRSLQNNSTAQKNTHIDADYLDRQEQGKNIDLKQKVRRTDIIELFIQ